MRARYGIFACLLALAGGAYAASRVSPVAASVPRTATVPLVETDAVDESTAERPVARPVPIHAPPAPTDDVGALTAAAVGLEDGRVIGGESSQRVILFTFDDGPERRTTPDLLDMLDRYGIRAVFFVTVDRLEGPGNRIREQRELLKEIVARGHIIGNHTVTHRQLPLMTTEAIVAELDTADRVLEELVGVRPRLFRPPGGSRSPRTDRILAERGYTQMLWSHGTGDFQVRSAEDVVSIFRRVLERRERDEGVRGGVVLMHDTHPWTVEAFPRIMDELQRRNCELLAEGEELYDVVGDPALFYTARDSAEPGTLAPHLELPPAVHARRQADRRAEARRRCEATVASR